MWCTPERAQQLSKASWTCARSIYFLAFGLAACAGTKQAQFETISSLPEQPRRSAAVAIDPVTQLPPAGAEGYSHDGLVVLKAPANLEAAKQVVHRFFTAVANEDLQALESVVSEGALLSTGKARVDAIDYWRLRLERFDYRHPDDGTSSVVLPLTALTDVEPSAARSLGLRTLQESGNIVIQANVAPPSGTQAKLFGEEISFLLEVRNHRYQIVELAEPFRIDGSP